MRSGEKPSLVVGVVADTHIPDRVVNLHPSLMPALEEANPDIILHAGDISSRGVLSDLGKIAPVIAVRGNRDIFFGSRLPKYRLVELDGIPVALMHGHGSMLGYLKSKMSSIIEGYRLRRYLNLLSHTLPAAKVVVFGHTHHPENLVYNHKLLFNPGSAGFRWRQNGPSFGLLRFYRGEKIMGEIVKLDGATLKGRKWIK